MPVLHEADVLAIRKQVHDINNALNVISMQSELVKMLAADSAAAARVEAAIDTVLKECAKAGAMANEISAVVKTAE